MECLAFQYKTKDIPLDQIKMTYAEDFADILILEKGLENNSAMKYLKHTKQVMRVAVNRDWLHKNHLSEYSCPYSNPERDILTETELMPLYTKKLNEIARAWCRANGVHSG